MRKVSSIVFGLAFAVGACGGDGGGDNEGTIDASAPDATPVTIDAQNADARRPSGNACDRVDIVFAVDASSTMREEVAELSANVFPQLLMRLRAIGNGNEDYRVGVLDTCPVNANFHTLRDNDTPEGESCNFESGQPWMDTNSSDLEGEFTCAAQIYIGDYVREEDGGVVGVDCTSDNDDEQPGKSIAVALSPDYLGPGGDNEGFLRDNALLLMVGITDEDETPLDEPNGEDAYIQSLYDELVAVKGDVNRMVFMGVGGSMGCEDDNGYGAQREARRLRKLTDHFITAERGVFWDLCDGQLEDGLAMAMEVIERTCLQVE